MKVLGVVALLAAASPLVSAGQYCNADKSFCVNAVVSGTTVTVTYGCKATGWCGFGIGSGMADADVVVGWNNGASFVVSDRTASGRVMPAYDAVQAVTAVTSPTPLDPSHTITISFSRPVGATGSDKAFPSGSASFIYAMSDTAPATPASASSTFGQHTGGHAAFSADLSAQSPTSTSAAAGTATTSKASTATGGTAPSPSSAATSGTKTTGSLIFGLLSALFLF
ncbi:hypothetical protein BJ742DRAFT_777958 [Cladochytrium replicatum]|nr:hypothetical protein BJ742DRAFT_777958 [Cladochytrium replicatum]